MKIRRSPVGCHIRGSQYRGLHTIRGRHRAVVGVEEDGCGSHSGDFRGVPSGIRHARRHHFPRERAARVRAVGRRFQPALSRVMTTVPTRGLRRASGPTPPTRTAAVGGRARCRLGTKARARGSVGRGPLRTGPPQRRRLYVRPLASYGVCLLAALCEAVPLGVGGFM